jgi:hypothetical protein
VVPASAATLAGLDPALPLTGPQGVSSPPTAAAAQKAPSTPGSRGSGSGELVIIFKRSVKIYVTCMFMSLG